ncbi:MAG: trigger factor [Eggerthellaceae bacterium]|nr:trigger factor [Eggerthellaceae bacterium]
METKLEVLEGNRAKVTVTIDEKTIADRIKKQYKQVANQYTIPGFRRGKAPRPVIDNALGKDYVRAVVTDDLVNESYPEAIEDTGIFPVGQPDFDEENMDFVVDGQAYTFDFEVDTKPTLELSSYDPVEIELPPEKVTDKQIDDEIDALLEHYMDIVPAPANTKVKEDKYVNLKITATDDNGEDIPSITTDELQYGLDSSLFPPTFDEQILGLKKGDTKQFSIDMPSEAYAMTATLAGKTAQINFDIEVLGVLKKKLPELTDEWVQNKIGVETVQELRDELSDEVNSQREGMMPLLKENRVLTALQERLEGDVPEGVLEESEATLLQDFFNQLQRQGITLDVYLQQQGITSDQFRDDVKQQAADMAKQDMALDAYAAHEGFEVTDEDIRKEFEIAGVADPDAMMAEWRQKGQMYLVRQGILRQKAAQALVDGAIVTEEAPKDDEAEKSGKHAKGNA